MLLYMPERRFIIMLFDFMLYRLAAVIIIRSTHASLRGGGYCIANINDAFNALRSLQVDGNVIKLKPDNMTLLI